MSVVGHVHAPNGVVHQFTTDGHLISDGLLTIMHNSRADMEILVDGIIQVQSQECLALHAEGGLILQRNTDVGTSVNNALVGDGHSTHGVVNLVVSVLGQRHTASSHNNRTTGDIGGIKFDDTTRTGLVLARQHKLVLIAELLSHCKR